MTGTTFLTIAETASILRVAPKLVRKLIARRELHAVRLGRIFRIPASALSQMSSGPSPAAPSRTVDTFPDVIPPGGRPGRPRKLRRRVVVATTPSSPPPSA
jgi:excisionase family DNA binding protein